MLLLCGATGDLGGRIARTLSDREVPFRALVRPGHDAFVLESLGAEVVRGDLTDRASLPPALAGITTVITTANALGRLLAGADDVSIAEVDLAGNANLIECAEDAGVERFVFLSMVGIDDRCAHLSRFAAAKLDTERRLEASSMRSVIVRSDKFQEVWLSPATGLDPEHGKVLIFGRGQTHEAYVAEDDVAQLVVELALEPDPPARVDVGGPERLTREQVAIIAEHVWDTELRRRHVPRPVLRMGASALAHVKPHVASLMGMSLFYDTHEFPTDDKALREHGITPRRTSTYLLDLQAAG